MIADNGSIDRWKKKVIGDRSDHVRTWHVAIHPSSEQATNLFMACFPGYPVWSMIYDYFSYITLICLENNFWKTRALLFKTGVSIVMKSETCTDTLSNLSIVVWITMWHFFLTAQAFRRLQCVTLHENPRCNLFMCRLNSSSHNTSLLHPVFSSLGELRSKEW